MRILTDIDPKSTACPEPQTSWARWTPSGSWRRVAEACFADGTPLYVAEIEGRKMSGEFPLVVWRSTVSQSQMTTASKLAPTLSADLSKVVMVATDGAAFKGHFDRHWASGHRNLHVTVLVNESLPCQFAGIGYAIVPVLALVDAAKTFVGSSSRVGIKWVNDIMLENAKIGGALGLTKSRGADFISAIMGMGLNVGEAPPIPPTMFVPRVGSLAGGSISGRSPLELLRVLLSSFASNHTILLREGGKALASRYRHASSVIDRRVCVFEDGPGCDRLPARDQKLVARGRVETITDSLHLVINGEEVTRGRLAWEEDYESWLQRG